MCACARKKKNGEDGRAGESEMEMRWRNCVLQRMGFLFGQLQSVFGHSD